MIKKLIEVTRIAGEILKSGFNKDFLIEQKGSKSNLVTEIDKKSEQEIKNFISKNFPSHNILAEESGYLKGSSEYTWVIDPLDGTTNFAHGLPIFSVSIGLTKGEEIIAGAVFDVMNNSFFFAEKNGGAEVNGKSICVSKNADLEQSVLATGFPYNIRENPNSAIEKFNKFILKARAVRRLGCASIDFCYVALGVFDGYWEVHLHPWDICAGKLIVEEAGGKVTDFANHEINIFSKQILASNGQVHSEMQKILSLS